jgi:nucleolin
MSPQSPRPSLVPLWLARSRFLLRRSAARALSAAPSKAFIATPRSLSTISPATRARQQQLSFTALQRRFASDDATKTPDNFAQTVAETPLEDGLTPAESAAPVDPTDKSATVTADALEAAAQEQSGPGSSRPHRPFRNSDRSREPIPPSKNLYVGNLFYEVTAEQLEGVFSRFGEIESVRLIYDSRGLSRGWVAATQMPRRKRLLTLLSSFGYVDFKNLADAQTAVDNLNQQVFEGRNLVCQFNRPSPARDAYKPASRSSPREERTFEPAKPSSTLFIGNMSFEMSDKDLNELFRDIQNVLDVRVAIDRRTGQPRGFAHADFVDVASARKAKELLAGKSIYGREIRVDFGKAPMRQRRDSPNESSPDA